jgi:hypothetical protein
MLELLICSLVTIVPDYLYRRYVQGKRFGKEITFFSVWHELRWGITACLMLTVALITMIFYYHPSTNAAALYFRTVPILPEGSGRVAEVNVGFTQDVKQGDVLFRLDSSRQEAALETAKRKIAEVDASMASARADVVKAEAQIGEAKANLQQANDELEVKKELQRRNPGIVPQRDIEKLRCWSISASPASMPLTPSRNPRCSASPRCCQRRRQAPRLPGIRHKSISTRPSFAPGSVAGSSNFSFAPVISSPRSCARRES